MSMPTFVQFGAGNIGRSFIGQLFARGGYEVVFVDVVPEVIAALNDRRSYTVEVRDREPQTIKVENVRAVDGRDLDAVEAALAACELCGTAVGPKALPYIWPGLARGIRARHNAGLPPLDIILCENLRDAAAFMREGLTGELPADFPLDQAAGLIETSIGKMVPIMPDEIRRQDPLLVYAEAYNNLICDRRAFRNPVPEVTGLDARENMVAYVDRKSFIHNFGHALCAYFAHLEAPELTTTWEAVEHPTVGPAVRAGMWESARALIAQYPDEFNETNQGSHIEDLMTRFANKALGDTLYRVGRDLGRKLSREDRVIGPLLLQATYGDPGPTSALCAAAGMRFVAPDEAGNPFAPDAELAATIADRGLDWALAQVCGLDSGEPLDVRVAEAIREAETRLRAALSEARSIFT